MNIPGDKQTVNEIIARAELEPDVIDLYVEGRQDARLLGHFLREMGVDVDVFAIGDRLAVYRSEVQPYSDSFGEREKLIAAAAMVEQMLGQQQRSLTFAIDSDWALAVGPMPLFRSCLIMTDKPSIEHYCMEVGPLARFLTLGVSKDTMSAREVRSRLDGALLDVASIRLVLQSMNVSCTTRFVESCDLSSTPSRADMEALLNKSLSGVPKGQRVAEKGELLSWARGFRAILEAAGHPGRGHDLAPLLIKLLGLKGHFASADVVEALMRTSISSEDLAEHPFFIELLERYPRRK